MVVVSLVESGRSEKLKKHLHIAGEDEYQCSSEALNDFVLWSVLSAMPSSNIPRRHPLKRGYVADLVREGGVSPCCVILGLIYIQRVSLTNPHYLSTLSPRQLFLIAMMAASKYLNDEGEMEALTNSEWASIGATPKPTLDMLEQRFLKAIDWRLYVPINEFYSFVSSVEGRVALQQAVCRGWLSYTDLTAIWNSSDSHSSMLQYSTKVAFAGATLYLVCVSTLLAAAHSLPHLYSDNAMPPGSLLVSSSSSPCHSLDPNISHGVWPIGSRNTAPDIPESNGSSYDPCVLLDPPQSMNTSRTRWLLQPDPGPLNTNDSTEHYITSMNFTFLVSPDSSINPSGTRVISRNAVTSNKNLHCHQSLPPVDASKDHTHNHFDLMNHRYWTIRKTSPTLICNHSNGLITKSTLSTPQAMEPSYTNRGTSHWDPFTSSSAAASNSSVSDMLTFLVEYLGSELFTAK